MTSDKKCREVAARLRSKKPEEFTFPFGKPVLMHIFRSVFPCQMFLTNWILRLPYKLADLIDRPTCRIWYVPGSADRSCSACGVTFSTGTYQGGDHEEHEFMFCPNCGAEVVIGDE